MDRGIDNFKEKLQALEQHFNQLKDRFNYQNNRFAKEFLELIGSIKEIDNKIDLLKNTAAERFDDLTGKYLMLDQERLAANASLKRLEDKVEQIERRNNE